MLLGWAHEYCKKSFGKQECVLASLHEYVSGCLSSPSLSCAAVSLERLRQQCPVALFVVRNSGVAHGRLKELMYSERVPYVDDGNTLLFKHRRTLLFLSVVVLWALLNERCGCLPCACRSASPQRSELVLVPK